MPFYNDDDAKGMGWEKENNVIVQTGSLTNDQINAQKKYLKKQPKVLYNFLEREGIGKKLRKM